MENFKSDKDLTLETSIEMNSAVKPEKTQKIIMVLECRDSKGNLKWSDRVTPFDTDRVTPFDTDRVTPFDTDRVTPFDTEQETLILTEE
jgi:hypothetical protein